MSGLYFFYLIVIYIEGSFNRWLFGCYYNDFIIGIKIRGTYAIGVAPAGNTYTLTAAPQGPMAGDACGNLTLDNTGRKDRMGTESFDICWGR